MMNEAHLGLEEETENDENALTSVMDHAVGAAARAAYDAAYVTALKTARSVLRSTNAKVTLEVLNDMISVFEPDPARPEEAEDEDEDEDEPGAPRIGSLPVPPDTTGSA